MSRRFTMNTLGLSIKVIVYISCVFVITACASQVTMPILTQTNSAVPTDNSVSASDSNIILFRGNPQRTGSFDFLAIRQEPSVKWQTKISPTWLMPPILAEGILYTGSGDGTVYAVDVQTGRQLWSAGGFSALENSGAVEIGR